MHAESPLCILSRRRRTDLVFSIIIIIILKELKHPLYHLSGTACPSAASLCYKKCASFLLAHQNNTN
jgi:uncharacterized protein (DUF779 family)